MQRAAAGHLSLKPPVTLYNTGSAKLNDTNLHLCLQQVNASIELNDF